MRVTFVTRRYWPAIGGVESVAIYLGETLVEMGHEVSVVAQCIDESRFSRMTHIIRENKRFTAFERNGVLVEQFRPSRRRRALLLPFALELIPLGGRLSSRWLRRHTGGYYAAVVRQVLTPLLADADVVHVLGGELMALAAVDTAHRLGKPVVISPFAHPGDWGFDAGSIRAYREADVVIATTAADAEVYQGAGVLSERLRVAGLPVPGVVQPSGERELPGVPDGAPLVLLLGARKPTKGADVLLAAAPRVWERHPDARFAFVGPGTALDADDQRVLEVGRVSDAERARWLARANMLCLPSSSESFGLVVPEAWSMRMPVIVSDIPVLRELVDASGGGLAVARDAAAFAAAINSLLDDPQHARTLGQAGHSYWLAELTPPVVAQRHLEIYESLLGARTPAPLPANTSS